MSLPVRLRAEATIDLEAIRDWYEDQRQGLGVLFARRSAEKIHQLGDFPELHGFVWSDLRAAPIPRYSYLIYYRVFTDRVEVLGVFHSSRDASAWQSRA